MSISLISLPHSVKCLLQRDTSSEVSNDLAHIPVQQKFVRGVFILQSY
jgi:hypothetical protein